MSKHSPVDAELAKACTKNHEQIFKGAADPRIISAFTSDVVFDKAELIAWLETVTTDSVRISLGVYTPEFVARYPSAKANRVTTFIYPHSTTGTTVTAQSPGTSDPTAPFNLGTLTP